MTFALWLGGCFVFSGVDDPLGEGGTEDVQVIPTEVVPPRPAADTSDPADAEEMHFAAYDVKMIQPSGTWREYGLNLDGVVTDSETAPTACRPTADGKVAIDGNEGIDNQYGQSISPLLSAALPTAICEMTGSHYQGHGTFVAGIENWNGEPDDAQITAWIAPAVDALPTPDGVEPTTGITWDGERGYSVFRDGVEAPFPCFDGNDVFYLSSDDSLLAPEDGEGKRLPFIRDENAYIVGNVVVARFPADHPFTLMSIFRSLPALISEGYIVARLSADYTRIEESVLAGRFEADDIIDIADEIGTCNTNLLATFDKALKAATDLMVDPDQDHTNEICNAISVGIPFKAVRAKVAEALGPAWPPDNRCALEEQWSANEEPKPTLYNCFGSGSKYSFADQWDETKNPGMMDHCQSEPRTLIPDVLPTP